MPFRFLHAAQAVEIFFFDPLPEAVPETFPTFDVLVVVVKEDAVFSVEDSWSFEESRDNRRGYMILLLQWIQYLDFPRVNREI